MAESPPRVAGLRKGPRRGHQTIVLDDGRVLVCSDEACVRAGIRPGTIADEAYLCQLQMAEQAEMAHESALRLLSYRARSEHELRIRLARRGIAAEIIDGEMERLRATGLVDDGVFAELWVQERTRLAPRGMRLLKDELRAKGIAPEAIDAATVDADDHAAALALARARSSKLAAPTEAEFRTRVGSFLQRKGFEYGVIAGVVREVWTERVAHPRDGSQDASGAHDGAAIL